MSTYYLTRFRADPSKVRITVRPFEGKWLVRIASRDDPDEKDAVRVLDASARRALVRAFYRAAELGMPGLDPSMGWAYEHPHGGLGPRVTCHEREVH